MDASPPAAGDTAPHELLTATGGDRCATCQAPLASDQRYCVNCGERRGKTRFSFATLAAQSAPAPAPVAAKPRRPRVSASTSLIAGVATLLLAMGVGFLIGQNGANNTQPARAAAVAPEVIKIDAGGGGGGGGGGGTGGRSAKKQASKKIAGLAAFKAPKVKVTPKVAAAATQAANKVLGSSANNLAPATVQPGQSCSHGAGCQNGTFSGNYFEP
jgi:hypothetical protein